MQMHQIRYFLALCEEGNFTRAARRSGISQPSLTNAIGALERELGCPLFQRKPFTAMTALAYAIQPCMQRIMEAADQALQMAQVFRSEAVGGHATSINQQSNDASCSPSAPSRNLIHAIDVSELIR
jgi:DNA-binding transcriptional LysR family regulator